jgi:hypothetical protein
MSFVTKWMKQHGFSNSLVTSRICFFKLVCSYKGQLQNPKCVVNVKVTSPLGKTDTCQNIKVLKEGKTF